jgi:hypothetical protein
MEDNFNAFKKSKTTEHLNDLVFKGGEIKRKDIIKAEEISYNKYVPSNSIYDEYGFTKNNIEKLQKK